MIGTRGKGEVNTGTNHLGFRCVTTPGLWKDSVLLKKPILTSWDAMENAPAEKAACSR